MLNWLRKIKITSNNTNTYNTYYNALCAWFPDMQFKSDINYILDKIESWNGLSPNTVALRCTVLKEYMKYTGESNIANFRDIIEILKSVKGERKIPDYVSQEQYEHIITQRMSIRSLLIINLMYKNALRSDEVINININDYDNVNKSLIIRKPKNHRDRLIYLNDDVDDLLNRYIKAYKNNIDIYGNMFATKSGNKINHANLRKTIKGIVTNAGYPNLHCHSFRHGSAKMLLDHNVGIETIQNHLGHANIATTQVYLHFNEKQRDLVKNVFDSIS